MRCFIFNLLILVSFSELSAQQNAHAVISVPDFHVLYKNFPNQIEFACDKNDYKKLIVYTNESNCEIKRDSISFNYLVRPFNPGELNLIIAKVKKNDTINLYSKRFLVRPVPIPEINLGFSNNTDSIARVDIKNFQSVAPRNNADNFYYFQYKIESYTVDFICNEGSTFSFKCKGAYLNDEALEQKEKILEKLLQIKIMKAIVKLPDGTLKELKEKTFYVKP